MAGTNGTAADDKCSAALLMLRRRAAAHEVPFARWVAVVQILGHLCRPPLAPASARLYVGFVLGRRALNSRLYSSFR